MDKRTIGIIATVATALFCAFPGCCIFIFGAVTAAGVMPYTAEFNDINTSGTAPTWLGYVLLCVSLLLIAIPFVVGFFTLRNKPAVKETVIDIHEPIPPAS